MTLIKRLSCMIAALMIVASASVTAAFAGNYHPHPVPPQAPHGCYWKILFQADHGFAYGTLICWHPAPPPSTGGGTPPPPPPPPVVCVPPQVSTPTGCQIPVTPPPSTKPHVNNAVYCVQTSNHGWSSLNLYLGGLDANQPWRLLFEQGATVMVGPPGGQQVYMFTGIEPKQVGGGMVIAPIVPGKGASCDVGDINAAFAAGTLLPADPSLPGGTDH